MVSSLIKRIIGSRRMIIFTKAQKQEMHALHNEGMSQKDIGKRFNIGHSTVSIYLSTARKEKKKRYDTKQRKRYASGGRVARYKKQ